MIANPFGDDEEIIEAPVEGIIIGRANLPLANEGDALFHIARFGKLEDAIEKVEEFHEIYSDSIGIP